MEKLISIIVPVYNEEENIQIFYAELKNVLEKIGKSYDVIFVDDGSTDNTSEKISQLSQTDQNVKMIQFSRNFGKEIATTAGINACHSSACIIIDVDLQHPVEYIPEFIDKWEKGAEVVVGVRKNSASDEWIKKVCSYTFYKVLNLISTTPVVRNSTDYRLLDKKVIDEFNKFTERNRMTRGLIAWLGFKRDLVYFEAKERLNGKPKYSYIKLIRLATFTFVSHSLLPLKLAGYLGIFTTLGAGLLGFFIVITQYIFPVLTFNFSGPAQLAVLILFLIGIVLSCLGLIALYIGSIHGEVINRPLYVVRNKINF
ncbi:MAG: Glycosyl transferase family 2 [uncultured bacterium]|nr:MAG: Glycosyl transferase family 2 [uncultured bacterium]